MAWRLAAAMCLLIVSLTACDKPAAPTAPQLVEGQAFPSFMLDFIASGNDMAQSLRGKMLVLNIWATWCPPCRREMPGLDRLSKTLDPKRFAVIGLSTDDDTFLASEFLSQNGITFTNLLDQNGKMSRQLGLQVYPETFVISQDRTLVRRMTGLHDWDSTEMVSMLEGLYQVQQSATGGKANVRK
jgi:thiol-disulfide isomerase/thioredoxin